MAYVGSRTKTDSIMRALVIDNDAKARIASLKAHAERNIISLAEMKKLIETGNVIGDDDANSIDLFHGFRVVYSLEEHPMGLCHHISISVDTPGKLPNEFAVQAIMDEFGFPLKLRQCHAGIDGPAIGVICPVKP
jgi:hypothetical protein